MAVLATNKEARHAYRFIETVEAGIKLTGAEVRSAKAGHINLRGSFIRIEGMDAWLCGVHIAPYRPAAGQQKDYQPDHPRKLLMKKSELLRWKGLLSNSGGSTIVPDSFFTKGGLVKVNLAFATGKTKFDKRETIKKRETERTIRRSVDM